MVAEKRQRLLIKTLARSWRIEWPSKATASTATKVLERNSL
jgi:hypothetical protein